MSDRQRANNRFVKQAAILAIAGIFARLLGFLYRLPLTELIGDAGNMVYGVGYNVYTFLLVMSSAGIPAAVAKLVAARRAAGLSDAAHRVFKVAFWLLFVVGLVLSVLVFIFAHEITDLIFGAPQAALALQMLAPTVFIVALMAVVRGYFQGMNSNAPTAVSQVVEQVFNAVFSIILAHALWNFAMDRGYAQVAFGAAGGTLGSTVGAIAGFMFIAALYFLFRKDIIQRVRRDARMVSRLEREDDCPFSHEKTSKLLMQISRTSFVIILGTAVISISNLIDLWLVPTRLAAAGFDTYTSDVLFGQILGKFNPLTNLPAAISASLAVTLIAAISADNQRGDLTAIRSKINTSLRIGMLFTVPIAFGLAALGPQIVALLFPSHPEGGTLFMVGFPSIIFLTASQSATGVLQALDKARIPIYAAIWGALTKVVAGYILIGMPNINIYGAVIATTLCFAVTAIINCAVLFKTTRTKPDFKGIILNPVFASVGMALGAFTFYHSSYILLQNARIATIIGILAGILLYGFFMLLIGGLREEEVLLLPGGKKLLERLKRRGFM